MPLLQNAIDYNAYQNKNQLSSRKHLEQTLIKVYRFNYFSN
jgi:hypothetical protein